MGVLKFLWVAIRPISKAESTYGWWEIMNLLPPIVYFILPKLKLWASNFDIVWFAGIPALLFFIAGLKLQFRLEGIEKKYRYALSVGGLEIEWTNIRVKLLIGLSNAIDSPIVYRTPKDKTYIQIKNLPCVKLTSDDSGLIVAKGKCLASLPEINNPPKSNCSGKLHLEILYGSPERFLYKLVRDCDLDISFIRKNSQKEVSINMHYNFTEDTPIKKQVFRKAGSQIE